MFETLVVGAATGSVYSLLAVGLVLIYRGSRVLNFAHGEVGTLGLFVVWGLIERGWGWWPAAAAGVAMGIGIGAAFAVGVVNRLSRASQLTLAVATLGLLSLIAGIELDVFGGEPRFLVSPFSDSGIAVGSFVLTGPHIAALVSLAVISAILAVVGRTTKVGLAFAALGDDLSTARLMGVPTGRVALWCWGAGAGLAVIAALVVEPMIGIFHVYSITLMLVRALAAALLGGLRSPAMAALGGLVIGVVEAAAGRLASGVPGLPDVAILGLVLLLLLVRPQGLGRSVLR